MYGQVRKMGSIEIKVKATARTLWTPDGDVMDMPNGHLPVLTIHPSFSIICKCCNMFPYHNPEEMLGFMEWPDHTLNLKQKQAFLAAYLGRSCRWQGNTGISYVQHKMGPVKPLSIPTDLNDWSPQEKTNNEIFSPILFIWTFSSVYV